MACGMNRVVFLSTSLKKVNKSSPLLQDTVKDAVLVVCIAHLLGQPSVYFRSPFPYILLSVSVFLTVLHRSGKQDRDNQKCGKSEEAIEMKVIL